MKKKWQDVKKCKFAIKVCFNDEDVAFKLYDRKNCCLREITASYPMANEKFYIYIQDMYSWANKHADNNDERIYIHNPYWLECKDIAI